MFLMSYFTADDESVHLAVSEDGRRFVPLNAGRPLLSSTVGTGRIRDPFIGFGPDGRFHLLGTDGWSSTAIVHATSSDLQRWDEAELLPVMTDVPGAQNAWAPEFFTDGAGLVHIIWSSCVNTELDGAGHDWEHKPQDHRIWRCQTRDFTNFSASTIFFDPGYSVIDAAVVRTDGLLRMAFKDERGENVAHNPFKRIMLTSALDPRGPFDDLVGPIGDAAAEGPTLYQVDDRWVLLYDHFLQGTYGGSVSGDWHTWHPLEVSVPPGARHASVIRLDTVPSWILDDPALADIRSP